MRLILWWKVTYFENAGGLPYCWRTLLCGALIDGLLASNAQSTAVRRVVPHCSVSIIVPAHGYYYLFIEGSVIAQSTAQGHLGAFH